MDPTSEELDSLVLAAQKLWELDENRLTPGEDYAINIQQGKSMWQRGDAASERLFKGVKRETWTKPTFIIFYNLLDNYQRETGEAEVETAQERKETSDFLDAVMATKVMKYCHKYCAKRGVAPAGTADFKKVLYQMWFAFYRRDGQNDSCGFEHVFVGESKGESITGFHNWIQFYIEEGRGNVDYLGYVRPKTGRDRADDDDRLISVQFAWKGEEKNVSTFFVGTSPEFELALYTLCFLCNPDEEKTFLEIGPYDLNIVCYRIRSKYGDKVATAYPDLLGEDPTNQLAGLAL
ncbi:hypothetical protein GPECTOR_39g399 [Gonium pectorale]|uniref:EndoU domain-containing protein n=1 Tax=Gonium pectorale TaxID=33097 RepID=A0A150GBF8_GONPE|nr:hypothetical protein GPECTOR_39g399 [Gonium pectorale]|eukprot:KXZ46905.1 hypothetical protein GPECTOR_39g399 [Gonium pectorale]